MSMQQTPLEVGTVLADRYRLTSDGILQDLGRVYDAYDMDRGRPVVVLALSPRWGDGTQTLDSLREVQRAVNGLAVPTLVPFEHVGVLDGRLYLVRPRVEGRSLADLLARTERLDVSTAGDITVRLCEALAPLHRAGWVHGSLSPHSVVVQERANPAGPPGRAVIVLDAGLVPALRPRALRQGQPWGRIPYLSPEQAAGEEVHPSSDVYVIGCLLYEMLTGRPPFRAGDEMVLALQHLRQEPASLQILVPHVPPALVEIVNKALAKEPSARYRNASQLTHILRSQLGLQPPSPRPEPLAVPVRERLVVPPPPAPSPAQAWSPGEIYALEGGEDWAKEPARVDWLMIALLIAALIAVLGLIPLWRTVYRRYTAPPVAPASAWDHRAAMAFVFLPLRVEDSTGQRPETVQSDVLGLSGYHAVLTRLARVRSSSPSVARMYPHGGKSPQLGVQLTGLDGEM